MCNRFISSILFAIFLSYGITAAALQAEPQDVEPEEYAVYSALINSITSRITDGAIVIHDETLIGGEALQMDGGVDAEVQADFRAKNIKSYHLRPQFKLTNEYRLIQGADSERSLQSPVLAIDLSRAAINRAEDQAIVRIRYRGMGGMGWKDQLVVLAKRNGRWEVERKIIRIVQ